MLVVFADRQCTLLSVYHFKTSVPNNAPIHYVERKAFQDCFYNGLLLFQVVAKLTLVWRAYVQFAMVTINSIIGVVGVTGYKVAYALFLISILA